MREAPPADDGRLGGRPRQPDGQRIEASVRRSVEASLERVVFRRRRARGTGGEAPRPDRRAARGGELARSQDLADAAQPRADQRLRARGVERAVERARAGAGALATGAPAISSANSARETASAPATCSGPATSSAASSSERAREVADLDRAADLVREEGERRISRRELVLRTARRRRRSATCGRSAHPGARRHAHAPPPPSRGRSR